MILNSEIQTGKLSVLRGASCMKRAGLFYVPLNKELMKHYFKQTNLSVLAGLNILRLVSCYFYISFKL